MSYQTLALSHLKTINSHLPRFGARATLDLANFRLDIRARNRYYEMVPQFYFQQEGKRGHTSQLRNDVRVFNGWLPYVNKRWPIGSERLAFKQFCAANGMRAPRYSTQAASWPGEFIVRRRVSGSGDGVRGPFRRVDLTAPQCRLAENEFYDEFIAGSIAKAWYWDDRFACLELWKMPTVTGNGSASLHDLIAARAVPLTDQLPKRSALELVARYHGMSLDDIVPAGTSVLVDFRFGSPLLAATTDNANVIEEHRTTEVGAQFTDAGRVLWRGIPENLRASTLYTVDAIVDDRHQVWFLGMNCNPIVHPDTYLPMFEALFGKAVEPMEPPAPGPDLPPFPPGTGPPTGTLPLAYPMPANGPDMATPRGWFAARHAR